MKYFWAFGTNFRFGLYRLRLQKELIGRNVLKLIMELTDGMELSNFIFWNLSKWKGPK